MVDYQEAKALWSWWTTKEAKALVVMVDYQEAKALWSWWTTKKLKLCGHGGLPRS